MKKSTTTFRFLCLLVTVLLIAAEENLENFRKLVKIFNEIAEIAAKHFGRKLDFQPELLKALVKPRKFTDSKLESDHYDFIVVGCGSAGAALAARLSEDPKHSVLVLEAGHVQNFLSKLPFIVSALQFTSLDWQYLMDYEPGFAWGMLNQQISWPRGKALGGSSVTNYMIYSRGAELDYEEWEKGGNPGWGFEDVLPYFLRAEGSQLAIEDPQFHNTTGPWSVGPIHQSQLVRSFSLAAEEMGFPKYADYNDGNQFGFSPIQASVLDGFRHTTADAYIFPAKYRHNLKVLTRAFVTRILINPNTKTAYGVEYEKDGRTHIVYCKKEVILSAGAINTPQLLMLSGIGPKDHLESFGIPVFADLAVGKQLYDHPVFLGLNFITNVPLSVQFATLFDPLVYTMLLQRGDGPGTVLGGVEGIGFIHSNVSQEHRRPDVEFTLQAATFAFDLGILIRKSFRIRDDIFNHYWGPLIKVPSFSIFVTILHEKSRGYIGLRSRNPHVPPVMHGNYFTDPEGGDLKTLIAGIRFAIDLATRTEQFRKYDTHLYTKPVPGCEYLPFNSDYYWECAIRTLSYTFYHLMGSTKMGPKQDPYSVVDEKLNVHGIKRLRVADCGVIPVVLGAHTSAVGVMIGEKAADIIKDDWAAHG